jgi:hypothetical protein
LNLQWLNAHYGRWESFWAPGSSSAVRLVERNDVLAKLPEKQHRAEAKARRRKFRGPAAILALRPTDSPKGREPRRQLSPRIACRDKWKRVEALQREQLFQERYRAAWLRFKAGERGVPFPAGTYWMVVVAKQRCEGPPAAAPGLAPQRLAEPRARLSLMLVANPAGRGASTVPISNDLARRGGGPPASARPTMPALLASQIPSYVLGELTAPSVRLEANARSAIDLGRDIRMTCFLLA